jgi:hypothetical protein
MNLQMSIIILAEHIYIFIDPAINPMLKIQLIEIKPNELQLSQCSDPMYIDHLILLIHLIIGTESKQ